MALVLTHRSFNQTSAGVASSSFTPSNNSLLVVVVTATSGNSAIADPSTWTFNNSAGLTFTRRASHIGNALTGTRGWFYEAGCGIWTAPVTTGVSMTVTVSGTNLQLVGYEVSDLTGYDTSTPIGATCSSDWLSDGAASESLSASPASSSYIIAGLGISEAGGTATSTTAGTGWTQLSWGSNTGTGDSAIMSQAQYITGVTSSTVSWQDTIVGDTSSNQATAAIEILAAGGAATKAPPPYRNKPLRIWNRRF